MAADTPPTPAPRRPEPSRTPAPGSGMLLLFASGIGLVALGQFYLLRFPGRIGTGVRFLGLGLVAFAVALILASPAATGALVRARAWVAALVRQHPWRLSLVLVSGFLTWGVIDGLRSSGQAHGWSLFPLWVAACASYLLAFLPRRWAGAWLGRWNWSRDTLRSWRWPGARLLPWRWSGGQGAAWLRRHRGEVVALGSLTLLATVLRFVGLGDIPFTVTNDEGIIAVMSLHSALGEVSSPFMTMRGNSGSLYFYLIGQGMNLFGINAFGLRVTSALAGSLTIIFTFLLARNIGGLRLAVIAGALMTVSHIHIHFSRIVPSGNIQDAFFAVAVIYFLDRGLRRRSVGTLAFSGFLLGLFFHIYVGARLMILVIPLALTLYYILHREGLRAALPGLAAMAGALLITAAPMALWALTNTDEFNWRVNAVGIIQNGWLAAEVERQQLPMWRILLEQQLHHAMLAIIYHPVGLFYHSRLAMLDYFTAVAFLFGMVCAIARAVRDRALMLLVVWIVLGIITGSALTTDPNLAAYRILIILPALVIVGALGLVKIWDMVVAAGTPRLLAGLGCGLWLLGAAFINLNYYFREFPAQEHCSPHSLDHRMATRVGRYIAAQPATTQIYVFGEPFAILNLHWHFTFLSMGQAVVDAKAVPMLRDAAAPANIPLQLEKMRPGIAIELPPDAALPANSPLLMVFLEQQESEYRKALVRFPGGRTEELNICAGDRIIPTWAHHISPAGT